MPTFLSPSHGFICFSCWHSCSRYSVIILEGRCVKGDWRQGWLQLFKGIETPKALFWAVWLLCGSGDKLCAPRGTCFPAFAWHFPHWVQLSKRLQYPSGCQGNISPWRDVRDDRGRALILKSCQATQWVGDITGAIGAGQTDRSLQRESILRRLSSQSHLLCNCHCCVPLTLYYGLEGGLGQWG